VIDGIFLPQKGTKKKHKKLPQKAQETQKKQICFYIYLLLLFFL